MRFRILGPLEVWEDGRRVSVGGPQQRALLAVLLLNANQVVSADRLMSELWGGEPPPQARRLLQGCVVRLRRVLGEHQPLVTRAPGYLLEVRPGELDLDRFDELVDQARHASPDDAAARLTEALALWRGPALDGVGTEACQTQARRLDERRQAVLEDRVDADLRRGRHADLVGELRVHVKAHPLRERLWAQLMLALYGAGRQADALAAYRELRTTLIDQLGVEPNAAVRDVESAILAGGDALAAYRCEDSAPRLVPAQLPPVAAAFTGRSGHLAELDREAALTVIDGMPGVGKTALAVRWAHGVRDRFPDGQLYLNLRGFAASPPVTPIEALTEFLHALGVPAQMVPGEADRAAAQFRSLLADRKLLVLLDDAGSADQVRPLLPAGSGCRVVVTSRDRLGGLVARDGARRVSVDVLTPDEAMALLREVVGVQRVQAEPEAAAELGRACALLPLALRIAAAAITDTPHRTIAGYVAGLSLGTLAVHGDEQAGVRATFDLSYGALPPDAQRMFCLLGQVPGPDFPLEAAAAIGDERLVHRLAAAHLLEEHAPGRYAFHDLLRAYALERAGTDEPALSRLFDWYLDRALAAVELAYPEKLRLPSPGHTATFDDDAAALRWLDAERAGLVAVVRHAAERGPRETAWRLADALRGYFWGHGHWVDWSTTAEAGLAAAEADGDPHAVAASCVSLGDAHRCRNRYPRSVQLYTRAAAQSRDAGWPECEGVALGNLGVAYWETGCLRQSVEVLTRALAISRAHGWVPSQAANLSNLGMLFMQLGQLDKATDHFTRALALEREHGMRGAEGVELAHLGLVDCLRGRFDTAMNLNAAALTVQRELGNRFLEGATLRQIALVHRETGRGTEALRAAGAALTLARESGNRLVEAVTLATLGTIHHQLGHHAEATDQLHRALRLGRHIGAPDPQIEALIGLAATGENSADQAVALAIRHGYRLLEGQALTARASLHLARGRVGRAVADAEVALAIHRETGHRPGEDRALLVLRRVSTVLNLSQ